jgi:general secretion pathway protein K
MKHTKGSALVMVLVAIAIMIFAASTILVKSNRVFFTTKNIVLYDKAKWYVEGIERIIMKYMRDDFKKNRSKVYLGMNWAQENQVIPLDDAMISGSVKDEMACININALDTEVNLETETPKEKRNLDYRLRNGKYPALVFTELLKILGVDESQAEMITSSTIDWLDADLATFSSVGAEDQFYMANHKPYLTNQGMFYDKSELRAVQGMTDVIYRRLEPMICALPNKDFKISINTLKRKQSPLIQALFLNQITLDDAAAVIEQRPSFGWDSYAGFFRMEGLESAASQMTGLKRRIQQAVVVNSMYFVADVKVKFEDESYAFKTRFYREGDTKIVVYQRLIGELHE